MLEKSLMSLPQVGVEDGLDRRGEAGNGGWLGLHAERHLCELLEEVSDR
jgi:hypothetical protein